jgi:hypothetical protein
MVSPKCKYFDAIFKSNFEEKNDPTTKNKVHEVVVQHFQLFLECIVITTHNCSHKFLSHTEILLAQGDWRLCY